MASSPTYSFLSSEDELEAENVDFVRRPREEAHTPIGAFHRRQSYQSTASTVISMHSSTGSHEQEAEQEIETENQSFHRGQVQQNQFDEYPISAFTSPQNEHVAIPKEPDYQTGSLVHPHMLPSESLPIDPMLLSPKTKKNLDGFKNWFSNDKKTFQNASPSQRRASLPVPSINIDSTMDQFDTVSSYQRIYPIRSERTLAQLHYNQDDTLSTFSPSTIHSFSPNAQPKRNGVHESPRQARAVPLNVVVNPKDEKASQPKSPSPSISTSNQQHNQTQHLEQGPRVDEVNHLQSRTLPNRPGHFKSIDGSVDSEASDEFPSSSTGLHQKQRNFSLAGHVQPGNPSNIMHSQVYSSMHNTQAGDSPGHSRSIPHSAVPIKSNSFTETHQPHQSISDEQYASNKSAIIAEDRAAGLMITQRTDTRGGAVPPESEKWAKIQQKQSLYLQMLNQQLERESPILSRNDASSVSSPDTPHRIHREIPLVTETETEFSPSSHVNEDATSMGDASLHTDIYSEEVYPQSQKPERAIIPDTRHALPPKPRHLPAKINTQDVSRAENTRVVPEIREADKHRCSSTTQSKVQALISLFQDNKTETSAGLKKETPSEPATQFNTLKPSNMAKSRYLNIQHSSMPNLTVLDATVPRTESGNTNTENRGGSTTLNILYVNQITSDSEREDVPVRLSSPVNVSNADVRQIVVEHNPSPSPTPKSIPKTPSPVPVTIQTENIVIESQRTSPKSPIDGIDTSPSHRIKHSIAIETQEVMSHVTTPEQKQRAETVSTATSPIRVLERKLNQSGTESTHYEYNHRLTSRFDEQIQTPKDIHTIHRGKPQTQFNTPTSTPIPTLTPVRTKSLIADEYSQSFAHPLPNPFENPGNTYQSGISEQRHIAQTSLSSMRHIDSYNSVSTENVNQDITESHTKLPRRKSEALSFGPDFPDSVILQQKQQQQQQQLQSSSRNSSRSAFNGIDTRSKSIESHYDENDELHDHFNYGHQHRPNQSRVHHPATPIRPVSPRQDLFVNVVTYGVPIISRAGRTSQQPQGVYSHSLENHSYATALSSRRSTEFTQSSTRTHSYDSIAQFSPNSDCSLDSHKCVDDNLTWAFNQRQREEPRRNASEEQLARRKSNAKPTLSRSGSPQLCHPSHREKEADARNQTRPVVSSKPRSNSASKSHPNGSKKEPSSSTSSVRSSYSPSLRSSSASKKKQPSYHEHATHEGSAPATLHWMKSLRS